MRVPNRTINFRLIFQVLAYSIFLFLAILIRQDLSEVRKQILETRNSDDFVDIYENGSPQKVDSPLQTSIEEESLGVSMPKKDDDRKLITSQTYGIIAGGGLGNQLFELVSLLGIAKTTGRTPFLNPGNGALMQLLQANILPRFDKLLDNFELKLMQPELYTHVIFNRICCRYDPVERIAWYNSSVVHLQGVYFQSFKYFHKYRNSVRTWLTPHWLAMKRAQSLVPETSLKNFKICTHVRRGDFVSDGMHRPSDVNFTHEATEHLVRKYQQHHPNISVVVLGNDPLWAQMAFAERMPQVIQMFPLFFESVQMRKRSNLNYDITFAPTLTPEIDLAFSRQFCDAVLITAPSSTFGWWLGYLAKDKADVYYRDITQTSDQVLRQLEPADFYPPEWIMLRSNQDSSIIFEGKGKNPFF
ncbi:unnamed protein product [Auanema sp. JU1783]|nr:unnamed protein product [Auanema sp. JU1783]